MMTGGDFVVAAEQQQPQPKQQHHRFWLPWLLWVYQWQLTTTFEFC
jgi:hypothetical protein